ncbi:AAA family ATPase, partial [bacterium]|nr:AAA family ATPase [bacterium]
RYEIFKVHTKGKPLAKDVDLKALAKETKERVGSDIEAICREAAMSSVREFLKRSKGKKIDYSSLKVSMKDFREAMKTLFRKS